MFFKLNVFNPLINLKINMFTENFINFFFLFFQSASILLMRNLNWYADLQQKRKKQNEK